MTPISSTKEQKNYSPSVTRTKDNRPSPADVLQPGGEDLARALSHPSRRRIVEALRTAPHGLTAFELAEQMGLHHNAIRQHVSALAKAGLVSSHRDAPRGRGRPSIRHRLVGDDASVAAGHAELVRLLMGLVLRSGFGEDDVEAFGYEQGLGLGHRGGGAETIMGAFVRLGFAPEEVTSSPERRAGRLEARLMNCPFRDAVEAPGGEVVCRLHRGIAAGLAERAGDAELREFEIRAPREAGCRMVVDGLPARDVPV
jgi:predicted ArsR family transcriptional regulator